VTDPNEIAAFLKACRSTTYLLSLRETLDARLKDLGIPAVALVPVHPAIVALAHGSRLPNTRPEDLKALGLKPPG
jgi:hypothetical protein